MLEDKLTDINIKEIKILPSPQELLDDIPCKGDVKKRVIDGRKRIKNILDKKDKKLMFIVGPCSIHNPELTIRYANLLKQTADKVKDKIQIIMRAYFEKPRTSLGWEGFLYDPDIDGSGNIEKGVRLSRQILYDINSLGLLAATEFLGLETPQFYADLISYGAIGARTSESPGHRNMASGLSMPVGIKNPLCGDLKKTLNGVIAARNSHTFLGSDRNGRISQITTKGNPYSHAILRGRDNGPNYDEGSIKEILRLQKEAGIDIGLVIDASHANSGKDPYKQPKIVYDIVNQRLKGNNKIVGIMVESHIEKGMSKTDPCLPWKETNKMIMKVYGML